MGAARKDHTKLRVWHVEQENAQLVLGVIVLIVMAGPAIVLCLLCGLLVTFILCDQNT